MNKQKSLSMGLIVTAKAGLIAVMLALVSMAGIAYIIYSNGITYQTKKDFRELDNYLSQQVTQIRQEIDTAKIDAIYLSSIFSLVGHTVKKSQLQQYLKSSVLPTLFERFIQTHTNYYRINILSADGGMLLSVTAGNEKIDSDASSLVNYAAIKEHFISGLKQGGEVYVSGISLGDLTQPRLEKAIITVVAPILSDSKSVIGFIAIDATLSSFFDAYPSQGGSGTTIPLVANNNGDFFILLNEEGLDMEGYPEIAGLQDELERRLNNDVVKVHDAYLSSVLEKDGLFYGFLKININSGVKKRYLSIVYITQLETISLYQQVFVKQIAIVALLIFVAVLLSLFYIHIFRWLKRLVDSLNEYHPGDSPAQTVLDESDDILNISCSINNILSLTAEYNNSLRSRNDKILNLIENMDILIWMADIEPLKFTYASPWFEALWGAKVEALYENSALWFDKIHPHDRIAVEAVFNEWLINPTGICSLEYRIVHDSGDVRWLYNRVLIDHDAVSERQSITGFIEDITPRKVANEEINEYRNHLESLVDERARELEEAYAKVKELERLKSLFIASMSHELRTPLNSIIGFAGIMLQGITGEINEQQKDKLQRVYNSGKHLLELVTDIIDLSKIEAGHVDANLVEFDLAELIDEAVFSFIPQAEQKGLAVTSSVPKGLILCADKRRLFQCLLNCLSNAVKYTEEGEVSVLSTVSGNKVTIDIADSGIGISGDSLKRLFLPFERIDSHLKNVAGGTGLGLYLTKKIAKEILHGEVNVRSQVGVGSVFSLTIPLKLM